MYCLEDEDVVALAYYYDIKVVEIYLDEERYNPRLRSMIPGAWMAVLENGDEFPICRDYEAANAEAAALIVERDYK